jgi:GntR family transcriptional regulator
MANAEHRGHYPNPDYSCRDKPSASARTPTGFLDEGLGKVVSEWICGRLAEGGGCPSFFYGHEASKLSTMERICVDRSERTPLHDQVAAEIRRAIAKGEARPGERLPPARDLAAVLGVNRNTVLRALRVLRDEGLLDFRRGRGITVTASGAQKSAIVEDARELLDLARRLGYRRDDVISIIRGLS